MRENPPCIAMSNTQIDTIQTTQEMYPGRGAILSTIGSWLCVWEIYPILAIAAFLRFYQLTTTEFDADQALILQMARDAINHGLIFVRRYYGRIASIIASLLYATAAEPLHFNRFIWQLNIITPFVVLFIFALFWGVVDRRKGWLFPSLVLLGILIQLHVTMVILSLLVLVALLLSPGTVRLRDLAL